MNTPPTTPTESQLLLKNGWTVEPTSLYDEEGVDGWRWTSPDGKEYDEIGDHSESPPIPQAAMDWLASFLIPENKHTEIPKHSPLPWEVQHNDLCEVIFYAGMDLEIRIALATSEGNAAFIVEACNSHAGLLADREELREALKAVKAFALPGATHIHEIIDGVLARMDAKNQNTQPE